LAWTSEMMAIFMARLRPRHKAAAVALLQGFAEDSWRRETPDDGSSGVIIRRFVRHRIDSGSGEPLRRARLEINWRTL
jgi:hypothetical protein